MPMTANASAGSGGLESRLGALADNIALKFGQRREQMKGELTVGGGGINLVFQTVERGPRALNRIDEINKIADRAGEAIQFPDDDKIAWTQLVEHLLQLNSFLGGPAAFFLINLFATERLQSVQLQSQVLILGADPRVANLHEESVQ